MTNIGFTYDPETAGSSVRFTPSEGNLKKVRVASYTQLLPVLKLSTTYLPVQAISFHKRKSMTYR